MQQRNGKKIWNFDSLEVGFNGKGYMYLKTHIHKIGNQSRLVRDTHIDARLGTHSIFGTMHGLSPAHSDNMKYLALVEIW